MVKIDLYGFVVTLHSSTCDQYVQSEALRLRNWDSMFPHVPSSIMAAKHPLTNLNPWCKQRSDWLALAGCVPKKPTPATWSYPHWSHPPWNINAIRISQIFAHKRQPIFNLHGWALRCHMWRLWKKYDCVIITPYCIYSKAHQPALSLAFSRPYLQHLYEYYISSLPIVRSIGTWGTTNHNRYEVF